MATFLFLGLGLLTIIVIALLAVVVASLIVFGILAGVSVSRPKAEKGLSPILFIPFTLLAILAGSIVVGYVCLVSACVSPIFNESRHPNPRQDDFIEQVPNLEGAYSQEGIVDLDELRLDELGLPELPNIEFPD